MQTNSMCYKVNGRGVTRVIINATLFFELNITVQEENEPLLDSFITACKRSYGEVMFLHPSVSHSVHRRSVSQHAMEGVYTHLRQTPP